MIYLCAQKNRRELVLAQTKLNGIDYLEVLRAAARLRDTARRHLPQARHRRYP